MIIEIKVYYEKKINFECFFCYFFGFVCFDFGWDFGRYEWDKK